MEQNQRDFQETSAQKTNLGAMFQQAKAGLQNLTETLKTGAKKVQAEAQQVQDTINDFGNSFGAKNEQQNSVNTTTENPVREEGKRENRP